MVNNPPASAETQVGSLVWDDPRGLGVTRPTHYNYGACALEVGSCHYGAHMLQLLKCVCPGAHVLEQKKPHGEKPACHS